MNMATLINEDIELRGLTYSFRCSTVHFHYGREHSSRQTDVVLKFRVLHLDSKVKGSQLTVTQMEARAEETTKPTPTVTHFLQQSHSF